MNGPDALARCLGQPSAARLRVVLSLLLLFPVHDPVANPEPQPYGIHRWQLGAWRPQISLTSTVQLRAAQWIGSATHEFPAVSVNSSWEGTEAHSPSLAAGHLPLFWQTGWFRFSVAVAVLLLFVAAFEIRLAFARRLTRLRLRIARDLHDEVGSNLGSIALLSEMLSRQSPAVAEDVLEIRRIAVQSIESLRDVVWFLDPASDSVDNLVLRMKDIARTMLRNVEFTFRSTGQTGARPSLQFRRNVFPMFKEILHNLVKHARAASAEISVEVTPRQFQLRVRDDGAGFDEREVRAGNGLKNLRRRAADLRGTVDIQSRPGAGTTITLVAPLP